MNAGKTVFAQLMQWVPWTSFARIVARHQGDHRVRTLSCAEQFRAMAFAQLTWRESLRDVEACLNAHPTKLYGMGFRSGVRRSTLADANERRDWRIWAELAGLLMRRARKLYADMPLDAGVDLDSTVYALDSTTIDLCLSLFDWAPFRQAKAAVKLHTLLDLRGSIPAFIHVSDGKTSDVRGFDQMPLEAGAFYVMDRGYTDFARLWNITQAGAFFVTRAKMPLRARRVYSQPVDRSTGLVCDQRVRLTGYYPQRKYPQQLRRIRLRDETGATLIFLTNNFTLPAATIAALYKSRWRVELFFKWIKQHLRIRHFMGTSENAVKTQIWSAVAIYVLIAIVRKELCITASLYTCLQILSVSLFEKTEVSCALRTGQYTSGEGGDAKQLFLLGF